jgi:hypothetical protein
MKSEIPKMENSKNGKFQNDGPRGRLGVGLG